VTADLPALVTGDVPPQRRPREWFGTGPCKHERIAVLTPQLQRGRRWQRIAR
jgi:hypothetical protein